jgi:hypothetical protein
MIDTDEAKRLVASMKAKGLIKMAAPVAPPPAQVKSDAPKKVAEKAVCPACEMLVKIYQDGIHWRFSQHTKGCVGGSLCPKSFQEVTT